MNNKAINAKQIKQDAIGRWLEIIPAIDPRFTEAATKTPIHVPCPLGTGNTDGFRFYEDANTTGGAISNSVGSLPDGLEVLKWENGGNFRAALEADHQSLYQRKTPPLWNKQKKEKLPKKEPAQKKPAPGKFFKNPGFHWF